MVNVRLTAAHYNKEWKNAQPPLPHNEHVQPERLKLEQPLLPAGQR